ncbi:MAG: hypothetical protein L0219_15780 [Phycisphaerales bacterium]|nr:hypothetical protein [Phycisphaerales bacterium]
MRPVLHERHSHRFGQTDAALPRERVIHGQHGNQCIGSERLRASAADVGWCEREADIEQSRLHFLQLQSEWSVKHEKLDIWLLSSTASKKARQPRAYQAIAKSDTQSALLAGGRFENTVSRVINRGQNSARVLKEYLTGPCQLCAAARASKGPDTQIEFKFLDRARKR